MLTAEITYFLYGAGFGSLTAFMSTFIACLAYSRMSGMPSPTGVVHTPAMMSEPLPFHIKDDRNEASLERQLLGRDQVDGLGR